MSSEVLVCPNCRARVFGDWPACKFCGEGLRAAGIGGTVHPDDLAVPSQHDETPQASGPRSPWEHGQGPESGEEAQFGPDPDRGGETGDGSGWSNWAGADTTGPEAGTADTAPLAGSGGDSWSLPTGGRIPEGPTGAESWTDEPVARETPGTRDGSGVYGSVSAGAVDTSDPDTQALVPLEGAEGTWLAGPAPSVEDEGPSGLDPVSWYSESGTSTEEDDVDDEAIRPDGDQTGAASSDAGPTDPGGPSAGENDRFDTDAIFREPEPTEDAGGTDWDTSSAIEQVVPEVSWEASADAWATPVEPEGKPRGQALVSREARLLIMGIVIVLVVFAVSQKVLNRGDSYPAAWAANVQSVASWVSSTRDLPFAHPVAVKTLDAPGYDAAVKAALVPEKSRQGLTDQVAMWRALGAVEGNPTASLGIVAVQHSEDGAFYDPGSETLVLRSGTDPAQLRVGVAGALSIALDDQHDDLSSLQVPQLGEDPLLAVVAGNAQRLRSEYIASQAKDLSRKFADRESAVLDASTELLAARTTLRSRLGRAFVAMVHDVDGAEAVQTLTGNPPVSSQQILMPTWYFNGQDPLSGDEPAVPETAEELQRGTIGAQSWYLVIAGRSTPAKGFEMAERWSGDHYVAYRKPNGQVCVTDVVRGADESATQALNLALNEWSRQVPGERIDVKRTGDNLVTVTSCDPGASADQSLEKAYEVATRAAVVRSDLAADYYDQGTKIPNGPAANGPIFTPEVAWCLADQVVASAPPEALGEVADRGGPKYRSLTLAAGTSCGTDRVDELFAN